MKSLLSLTICSALIGLMIGIAAAYFEVRPWAVALVSPSATGTQGPEASVEGQPRAQVSEQIYEFGKMERGTTLSHAFKIRNVGDQSLQVAVANTTCKCTVGDLENDEVPPGGETDVVLQWTAKTQAGPFRHGATLTTNDPQNSRIQLSVEGEVVESSTVFPGELLFGDVSVGQSSTAHLFVMSSLQEEVQVLEYELNDSELAEQIQLEFTSVEPSELPLPDAASGVKVQATYQAGQTIGRFHGWLELKTTLEKTPQLSILVAGSTVGEISIFGPGWVPKLGLLRMGSVNSRQGKQVKLNLATRGELAQTTEIEVLRVDPPALRATLGERRVISDKLVHVPLTVELPAGTPPMVRTGEPASSDAQIVLSSNHPNVSEIQLRVHFTVEP